MGKTTTISKTTYTFTVLHPSDYLDMDLEEALEESDTGHAVGWVTSQYTESVPDASVRTELMKLGNDGSFFDEDLKVENV